LSPFIADFLNLENNWYPLIIFLSFILAFSLPVHRGILQGLQRFSSLGISNIFWAIAKLVIGVLLVHFGLGLNGSLSAFFIAYCLAFILTLYFLKDIVTTSNAKFKTEAVSSYAGWALLAAFSFALLANFDVVLVKHFFTPDDAGDYSAVAVLGKITLYAPAGIAVAMFPKTAGLSQSGMPTRHLFNRALTAVLSIGIAILLVYAFFSESIVDILYGDKYPQAEPHLL
ncbi:MAG: oligosaccharide flippase family protein, partial [bacterium]|nr:oligosaccharide flippase family protein [bacterium]